MGDVTPEQWKPVVGFPNYRVSDLPRVYSVPRYGKAGVYLQPWVGYKDYLHVTLYRDGRGKKPCLHRVVAEAFLGRCPEGMEVLHGPSGKLDNRPSNLHYGTHLENVRDMDRDGTRRRGDDHQNAKLTMAIVAECRRRYAAGELLSILAGEFGVTPGGLEDALQGVSWKECPVPPTAIGHKQGEDHRDAKLTDAIVRECRARHAAGELKLRLAREFGVSNAAMHAAIIGKTWKHVA